MVLVQCSVVMDPPNLDEIKKTIRALLISAKNGLSPQQLLRDYLNIVGTTIPLQDLGFSTLTEAISKMPDVARVEKTFSGRIIYHGVPDTSSKHIADLVSKQRNSKPYSSIRKATTSNNSSATTQNGKAEVQVPVSFGIKMRQLMLSYQEGLLLLDFQEAFHSRFGYYVNVTSWGFMDITEALQSMNDIVKLVHQEVNGCKRHVIMPARKGTCIHWLFYTVPPDSTCTA